MYVSIYSICKRLEDEMFRYVCCGAVKLCKIKCNSSISFIMQRSCTAELSVVCTLDKDKSFFGVSANFY